MHLAPQQDELLQDAVADFGKMVCRTKGQKKKANGGAGTIGFIQAAVRIMKSKVETCWGKKCNSTRRYRLDEWLV